MQEFNFVTDGSATYRLGGNDWYVAEQDNEKVMLVDTDCEVGGEELKTPWNDADSVSQDGKSGQAILNYVNRLADTYFTSIKHAIEPTTVEAGTGKLENAYMWPMSRNEFAYNRHIGGKIVENSGSSVWTRTFSSVSSNGNCYAWYAWYAYNANGDLSYGNGVSIVCRVAPAFYLRKSAIDHITEDGEIVLKPADIDKNSTSSDTEKLLSQVREYAKTMADVNRFEQKLAYAQGNDVSALKAQEMVDVYERILYLASNITD